MLLKVLPEAAMKVITILHRMVFIYLKRRQPTLAGPPTCLERLLNLETVLK